MDDLYDDLLNEPDIEEIDFLLGRLDRRYDDVVWYWLLSESAANCWDDAGDFDEASFLLGVEHICTIIRDEIDALENWFDSLGKKS